MLMTEVNRYKPQNELQRSFWASRTIYSELRARETAPAGSEQRVEKIGAYSFESDTADKNRIWHRVEALVEYGLSH